MCMLWSVQLAIGHIMRKLAYYFVLFPMAVLAQGNLENPVAGATESGIGLVSGWHCTAREITVFVDGIPLGRSGVGSVRNDTVGICGHANTGFSLLYNYNIQEPGTHEITVYADGQLLERRFFQTVRSAGIPFLQGVQAAYELPDFPGRGKRTIIQWSEAKQSFVVTGAIEEQVSEIQSLAGSYSGTLDITLSGSSCSSLNLASGTTPAQYSVSVEGNTATIVGYIPSDACTFVLTKISGNASTGFNMAGHGACLYAPAPSSITATNLRRSSGKLLGRVESRFSGCTQTLNLR